jgi:hypothetical protein
LRAFRLLGLQMLQFFLSSWRSGFRNRVFFAVLLLGVALVGVAYLSASFSPRQPLTVALDVGLSGLRVSLVLFTITLVQDLVGREIEQRSVVLTLSYPTHRSAYLIGRYCGVLALAGVAALILGLLLWIAVMMSGANYDQQFRVQLGLPFWVAVFGVWLDIAVVAAFTLWIATLSTVTMLPLALGAMFRRWRPGPGRGLRLRGQAARMGRLRSPSATAHCWISSAGCCRISPGSTGERGRCTDCFPTSRRWDWRRRWLHRLHHG